MVVEVLDEPRALTFGSPENFWAMYIHRKEFKKMFYERLTRVNIPARSVSDLR